MFDVQAVLDLCALLASLASLACFLCLLCLLCSLRVASSFRIEWFLNALGIGFGLFVFVWFGVCRGSMWDRFYRVGNH